MIRKVIPTVFARNKMEFKERFRKLIKISKELQIDFMDGGFVKNKSVSLKDIPNLKKYKKRFEAHLMVNYPSKYLSVLKEKGFSKVIFHIECKEDAGIVINRIKKLTMEVYIAINPNTSSEKLDEIISNVDGVLFMGVYPGREKQKFIGKVYGKIREFHRKHKKIRIQVDGGINLKNVRRLRKNGFDIINSGSFISEAANPLFALNELKEKFI